MFSEKPSFISVVVTVPSMRVMAVKRVDTESIFFSESVNNLILLSVFRAVLRV